MKDINLLMAGNTGNYSMDLTKYFLSKNLVSSVFILYYYFFGRCEDWKDFEIKNLKDHRVTTLSMEVEYKDLYDKICNLNTLPALSKELLEKMLPYESMCIKMARRRYGNFPVVEYEEGKRDYHKILRYWNYIFEKESINAVYFETLPHLTTTYVIYSLAKIKDIPILVATDSIFPERKVYGDGSIEANGRNIEEYYNNILTKLSYPLENEELEKDIKVYYDKYSKSASILKKNRKNEKYEKKWLEIQKKEYFGGYIGIRSLLKPQRHKIQTLLSAIFIHKDLTWYKEQQNYLRRIEKSSCYANYYKHHLALTLKEYNEMAEEPDYSKKFIFFGLQLTPEATIMPWAGVFGEQYTSVQLLARAAEKYDMYIYVKEHFVQSYRERAVYELLQEIPNVRLIKSTVSSFDLMDKCFAVATQTGTVIIESALRGKPALVLSEGWNWKGLPNVFEIKNEIQGAEVISDLMKEFKVEKNDIRKYFYAIQEKSMYFYRVEKKNNYGNEKYKRSLKDQERILTEFFDDHFNCNADHNTNDTL